MFEAIDRKKAELDARHPFPPHTIRTLREHLIINWTYHSNAIEGNTLTLSETKVVLEGITVGGKTLTEHFEAINHKEAILYIEDLVRASEPLSEWQIKNIHRLLLKNIQDEFAGVYRMENVIISGTPHTPPDYIQVPAAMHEWLEWVVARSADLHPIAKAALIHNEFVKIHPFVDGNGRTARLLLNLELMKAGYPPIVIEKEQRLAYYESLDEAHMTGDSAAFLNLVVQTMERTLDWYLNLVR